MGSVVLESQYKGVPFKVFVINQGIHNGKFRAFVPEFRLQTSIQETIGGAVDRAIVNINKYLK